MNVRKNCSCLVRRDNVSPATLFGSKPWSEEKPSCGSHREVQKTAESPRSEAQQKNTEHTSSTNSASSIRRLVDSANSETGPLPPFRCPSAGMGLQENCPQGRPSRFPSDLQGPWPGPQATRPRPTRTRSVRAVTVIGPSSDRDWTDQLPDGACSLSSRTSLAAALASAEPPGGAR